MQIQKKDIHCKKKKIELGLIVTIHDIGLIMIACLKVRLITCNYQLKEKLQSINFY